MFRGAKRQMPSDEKSHFRQVCARLDALQSDGCYTAQGRVIYKTGQGSALAALLKEADETVLRRHLTFDHGAGQIVLDIADRRFLRVISTYDGLPQERDWSEVLRTSESADFLSWLRKFCDGIQCLVVRSDVDDIQHDDVDAGIPSALLCAASCATKSRAATDGQTFDAAVRQSMALARCAIDPMGKHIDVTQDDASLALLGRRQDICVSGAKDWPPLSTWRFAASPSLWLAYGHQDGRGLWCVVADEDLAALAAIWCRVIR